MIEQKIHKEGLLHKSYKWTIEPLIAEIYNSGKIIRDYAKNISTTRVSTTRIVPRFPLQTIFKFAICMFILLIVLACILGGITLCLHGVEGSSDFSSNIPGYEIKVNDAVPGVILFIIGFLIIAVTSSIIKIFISSK